MRIGPAKGMELDDLNVLRLGSSVSGSEAYSQFFLNAHAAHGPRQERRMAKVKAMDEHIRQVRRAEGFYRQGMNGCDTTKALNSGQHNQAGRSV